MGVKSLNGRVWVEIMSPLSKETGSPLHPEQFWTQKHPFFLLPLTQLRNTIIAQRKIMKNKVNVKEREKGKNLSIKI